MYDVFLSLQVDAFCRNLTKEVLWVPLIIIVLSNGVIIVLRLLWFVSTGRRAGFQVLPSEDRRAADSVEGGAHVLRLTRFSDADFTEKSNKPVISARHSSAAVTWHRWGPRSISPSRTPPRRRQSARRKRRFDAVLQYSWSYSQGKNNGVLRHIFKGSYLFWGFEIRHHIALCY